MSIQTPKEFLTYLNNGKCPDLSAVGLTLFLYDYSLYKELRDKWQGVRVEGFTTSCSLVNKKILLCCGFGIGSPAAVVAMEELVAAGVKQFISFGTAGGISRSSKLGDIVVCTAALRDEGTSAHYQANEPYSYPDPDLTREVRDLLVSEFPEIKTGKTWTTDAPYRETAEKLLEYREKGIISVEMEASALFTLGSFRQVKVASVFIIGDLLSPKGWTPGFKNKVIIQRITEVASALLLKHS